MVGLGLSYNESVGGVDSLDRRVAGRLVAEVVIARMNLERVRDNWERVQGSITDAAARSGRDPSSVRLVAVTKRNPPEWIRPLVSLGATDLGENYPQELWDKVEALADLDAVRWHLIGHLQSNKLKRTLPLVRLVHGVDSPKLLSAIDDWVGAHPDHPLEVCLQINTSGEESKHGWSPSDPPKVADQLAQVRHVRVVGLMTIAGYGTTDDEARPMFEQLRLLRDQLQDRTSLPLPELSMGMSSDFNAAIAAGSTLVRVGSALFEGVGDG